MLHYTWEKAFLGEQNVVFTDALIDCVLLNFVYNLIATILFQIQDTTGDAADLHSYLNSQTVVLNFKPNAGYIAKLKCDIKMIVNEILSASR